VTRSDMYGWGILVVQPKFNSFEHLCTSIRVEYDMAIECHQVHMLMGQGCKMMIRIEVKRVGSEVYMFINCVICDFKYRIELLCSITVDTNAPLASFPYF
jgi:hypothetical protein